MDMLLRLTARIVTVQESLAKSMADRVAADMDLASIWRTVSMSVATAAVNAVSKAKAAEPAAKKRKLPEAAQATPGTKKPRPEATSKKLQEIDAQIKEMNAQRKAKREAAAAAAKKKSKPEEDEEDEEPKPRKHKHSSHKKKKKHSKPAGESDSEDDDEASLNSDSAL